jgi:uncharacterized membrane-anchored protein
MNFLKTVGLLLLFAATQGLCTQASAEGAKLDLRILSDSIKYQTGQIHLQDGLATLTLPDSFRYVDPEGTQTLLTGIWGNPPSKNKTLGMIVPAGFDPMGFNSWCVVLSYQADGYVRLHQTLQADAGGNPPGERPTG